MVRGKTIESNSVDTGEVDSSALASRTFSESELRNITDFESAIKVYEQITGKTAVVATDELGDGFQLLDDKRKLVGIPMFFMDWEFKFSKELTDGQGNPRQFVAARVVANTRKGVKKYLITDGSTGIFEQLAAYTDRANRSGGLIAPNGLRVSDYTFENPMTGERTPASTYYVDLTPDE